MMDTTIDALFVERISALEAHLLDPIVDRSTLAAFNSQWSTFADDLQEAIDADNLSISTISMSHTLAERTAGVIQTFSELDTISENLMSSLVIETSSILEGLSTSISISPVSGDSDSVPNLSKPLVTPSLPSYIKPSYDWLLKNIHNPYPSTSIRNHFARMTKASRKDIDGWFIDARKRIGWNALRKEHFSNKRTDIVEAATRFFLNHESTQTSHIPTTDIDFASIELNARNLYSNKFFQSDLATQLDTVVKDMTPEIKARAKAEERRGRSLDKEESHVIRAISCYPSPDRSPSYSSPSPLPSLNEDDLETTLSQPISQSSRKRRASSAELLGSDDENHSNKRLRTDASSHNDATIFTTGLLSPASSIHESLPIQSEAEPTVESVKPPTTMHISSRKRRLSDAESQSPPKRLHTHHVDTRPEAALNPLPFSSALLAASEFDGWFNNHGEDPSLPDVESDSSAPLEVELYDFSDLYNEKQLTDIVQYPSPQIQDHDGLLSTTELPDIPSFDLDISTNAFNYDEFFSSDDYPEDFSAHDASHPNNPSNFSYELSSLGIDFSPGFFNFCETEMQPHMADHALVVDSSLPASNNPAARPDWAFPSFISSPSSATIPSDKFQNLLNIFPQATFNSSITMRPNPTELLQSMNLMTDSQVSAQAERAAKQQKLFEIKETARRLEAELAATPC